MSETMTVRRPGVITFVGVVLYIKAALAVAVGIGLIVERNNDRLQQASGQGSDYLVGTGVGQFIAAAILFWVAWAVMSGAKWARLAVGIVVGANLVMAVYWLITHHGGGLQWNALIQVGIGLWVLWALYSNDESEAFFEGHA